MVTSFQQATIDAFQRKSSGVVEDTVGDRNVLETTIRLRAKLDSTCRTVMAVLLYSRL